MRLLGFCQNPDYSPLERGEAFPAFHEDGDRYQWNHPGCWNYQFWITGVCEVPIARNTFDPIWIMGGEL